MANLSTVCETLARMGTIEHRVHTGSYELGKLWEAVGFLATGTEPIQARLTHACNVLHVLREDNFTGENRALYRRIWDAATAVEDDEHGAIVATTRTMDNEAAVAVAEAIWTLYNQVD